MKHSMITCIFFLATLIATFQSNSAPTDINVEYINHQPIIDGRLDQKLAHLKFNNFEQYYDFGDPVEKAIKVRYKLAYNDKYFYVYIETDADKISYNKRGYLYGDGFKIIIGRLSNSPITYEYYDLAYSPSLNKNQWDRQLIATYNTHHIGKNLSKDSKSQELAQTTKTGFEALIAWDDVHPINPLFNGNIGLNIYFAKKITKIDTLGYSITKDESIWDEEVLSRNLSAVNFIPPTESVKSAQIFKRNYKTNETIQIKTHALEAKDQAEVLILNAQRRQVISRKLNFKPSDEKFIDHFINPNKLNAGLYTVQISINGKQVENKSISILDNIDFLNIKNNVIKTTNNSNKAATSTILFHLVEAQKVLQNIKPYELASDFIVQWEATIQLVNTYLEGKNPYTNNQGPYRRAFMSKIDNTYQPYSIKLPNNYDANKKYPLLVFLHGSGQDEQSLLSKNRSNGQFIELAPLGRDLFKAYSFAESQLDIVEAIEDVKLHFSVDSQKIIIGGFSMGGYGALRSYFENPELYQGVAVFAGHPDLANQWEVAGKHPNFLKERYAQIFENLPVFIYHGTNDEALDFKTAEQLKESLLQIGAKVTTSFVSGRGHTYQDDLTNTIYHNWLEQFIDAKEQ